MLRTDPVAPLLLGGAAAAIIIFAIVIGSTPDEEEFRFAVLSTWLFATGLLDGRVDFWTPLLGFGVPQPFIPNFNLHPLMPLLGGMSPVAWVRLLLVAHTILGVAGMWRLTTRLQIDGVAKGVCLFTYLLATPVQNYVLTDFWPTHYVVWTTMPWLVLMVWRLLESDGRARLWWSIACGLAGGVVIASTNPGHAAAYWPAVASAAVIHHRRVRARLREVSLAAAIAFLIAAPTIVRLAQERPLFDPELPLDTLNGPLGIAALASAFVSPLWRVGPNGGFTRTLFCGGPFLLLAIAGAVRLAREYRQLALILAACLLLLFTPLLPVPVVSARFHYRDPLVLAAVLLAGVVLSRMFRARGWKYVGAGAVVVQIGVLMASAWPALSGSLSPQARDAYWWRGAVGSGNVAAAVDGAMTSRGRLLLSASLEREIDQPARLADGLGVNALAYRAIPVVNGWFKSVSTAVVSPDERMFYGQILTPPPLLLSPASLNVLGIRYVLANDEDVVPSELRRVSVVTKHSSDDTVVLYENPGAWPEAFLVDRATEQALPTLSGCVLSGLLCADWSAVAATPITAPARLAAANGRFDLVLPPSQRSRLLVVSQMFRDDWNASSPQASLSVRSILGGLIGVDIPPGVTEVHLRYRPVWLMLATGGAWLTIAVASTTLIFLARSSAMFNRA